MVPGVYPLPAIKAQEIALARHGRPFNSRVVKYHGFESRIILNVVGIESYRDSSASRQREGKKRRHTRCDGKNIRTIKQLCLFNSEMLNAKLISIG